MFLDFQAFFDESVSALTGEFVLAGYIAPAANWAKFTGEWEQLLRRHGTLAADNHYHFKMSEMAMNDERLARVPTFYRIIRKYVSAAVSIRISMIDFEAAKKRVENNLRTVWGINCDDFGMWGNVYFFSFRQLLANIHGHREKLDPYVPSGEKIELIFDDRSEKSAIRGAWDDIMTNGDFRSSGCFGNNIRFDDDREYLALQAADFWAWWVRKWYEEDDEPFPKKMRELDFGFDKGAPLDHNLYVAPIYLRENDIYEALMEVGLYGFFSKNPYV